MFNESIMKIDIFKSMEKEKHLPSNQQDNSFDFCEYLLRFN